MALSIASMFARQGITQPLKSPPAKAKGGAYNVISIPVRQGGGYRMGLSKDYLTPQTEKENAELLNTYYGTRATNPYWREMGEQEEEKSLKFYKDDVTPRKNVRAHSSWIKGIQFDPNKNLVNVNMNGKYYTYSATPQQLAEFMQYGSLGKAVNAIKQGSSIMNKTNARMSAPFNTNKNLSVSRIFGGR